MHGLQSFGDGRDQLGRRCVRRDTNRRVDIGIGIGIDVGQLARHDPQRRVGGLLLTREEHRR
jgi:hypothetical protein